MMSLGPQLPRTLEVGAYLGLEGAFPTFLMSIRGRSL